MDSPPQPVIKQAAGSNAIRKTNVWFMVIGENGNKVGNRPPDGCVGDSRLVAVSVL
jgi:hypothetical protein